MKLPDKDGWQGAAGTHGLQPLAGVLVLLETIAAAIVVVGLFAAASQPMNWTAAIQFMLCGGLGIMLWLADSRLGRDENGAPQVAGSLASCRPAPEKP